MLTLHVFLPTTNLLNMTIAVTMPFTETVKGYIIFDVGF
jgi:hypothetical protein